MTSKVHTPEPADERAGATGSLTGTLLNSRTGAGLGAAPSTPDDLIPIDDAQVRRDLIAAYKALDTVAAERDEWRRLMRIYRDAYTDMVDPDEREATRTMCRHALFVFLATGRLPDESPLGVVERESEPAPTPSVNPTKAEG